VVKVTSSKPINEPFLDFLVELNWPAGRLVREYTFLLDPPEIAAKQTARPVAEARVVETVRGAASAEGRQASGGMGARPSAQPGWPDTAARPADGNGRVVQPGETLRKIANETQYDGVSLSRCSWFVP
jgi:pilus assembly protein FimV